MNRKFKLRLHSIKTRLTRSIAVLIILSLALCGGVLHHLAKKSLEDGIVEHLDATTATVASFVQATVKASIRNYLRAVAEKNLNLVESIYNDVQAGELSEAEAKALAKKLLLSQPIGKTGYLYCINSDGLCVVHPKPEVEGTDVTGHEFVRTQMHQKTGYIEYHWANPGESVKRSKALYMTYFEPWDWIISASTYRDEFRELVNAEDFREKLSGIRLGPSGYMYILDEVGDVVVHPWSTANIHSFKELVGENFVNDMLQLKKGQLEYDWKEKDSDEIRKKIAVFGHLPELGWIVTASAYKDEVFQPLERIVTIVTLAIGISLLIALPFIRMISATITAPVERLVGLFNQAASGDLKVRSEDDHLDEIGELGGHFDAFMERLENNNAEMERFIYTVSHDLRSPLITILGFTGVSKEDVVNGDTEKAVHALSRIENAAKHMSGLLDELLALSRLGRVESPRAATDLGAIVSDVLDLLHGSLQEHHVSVEVGEMGTVEVDRARMMEVFQNLVENSIKYSAKVATPKITIGMREEGARETGCPVYFVQDNGCGVSAQYHEKIFGLFEQLDQSTGGTGVGLALVKRIIELHNGRIWVESDGIGTGATFCFTLNEHPDTC